MKVVLTYILSISGLVMTIYAITAAAAINISYIAGKHAIINMLRQSVNKAELMCKARKHSWYEPIGASIKIAAMAQSTDPNILAMSTKPAYDGGVQLVGMHWKKLMGHGKKAVMLVIGGFAMAIGFKTSVIFHTIVLIIALPCAIWFLKMRAENQRALVLARAEILPEVERGFAEGRYLIYQ